MGNTWCRAALTAVMAAILISSATSRLSSADYPRSQPSVVRMSGEIRVSMGDLPTPVALGVTTPHDAVDVLLQRWSQNDLIGVYALQDEAFHRTCDLFSFLGHMVVAGDSRLSLMVRPERFRVIEVKVISQDEAEVYWDAAFRLAPDIQPDRAPSAPPRPFFLAFDVPTIAPLHLQYGALTIHFRSPLAVMRRNGNWRIHNLFDYKR